MKTETSKQGSHGPVTRPTVSIGIPAYNGGASIAAALNSVLAQSYKNIEIIISDNVSTDNTEEICRRFAAIDRRITYYRQSKLTSALKKF